MDIGATTAPVWDMKLPTETATPPPSKAIVADLKKAAIAKDVAADLKGAPARQRDEAKAYAKKKVEALKERLKLIKRMFSNDPKQMAKALGQLVKDLKAALKDYRAAGGEDAPSSDTAAIAAGVTPPPKDEASAAYDKTQKDAKLMEAEGDLSFTAEIRGITRKIKELFEKAKLQTALKGPDKTTKEAFEDFEKAMKDLDKDLDDTDRDIRKEVPEVGLHLSVTA